jgi:hypothetical protein
LAEKDSSSRSSTKWYARKGGTLEGQRQFSGYAFVVFDDEQSIIQMLRNCQTSNNRVFFPIYTLNGLMQPVRKELTL